jgi:hypothetical protein
MSSEKLYTFTVPVTIRAVKTVYVKAENQEEAFDKFRDTDWYDCKTDEFEEEYEEEAALDEVQELDEEEAV